MTLEQAADALVDGRQLPVGRFVIESADESVKWSESLYEIHGFTPGEIVPTVELMAAHRHPDDRARVEAIFAAAVIDGEPFGCRCRLQDTTGNTRSVVLAGAAELRDGHPVRLVGYLVDITTLTNREVSTLTDVAIDAAMEHRGNIEQAKGALMLAYSLESDEAFALLRWHSQHGNVKIRDLSQMLVDGMSDPELAHLPPRRKIHQVLEGVVGPTDVIPPELADPSTAMLPPEPLPRSAPISAEHPGPQPVGRSDSPEAPPPS